eukprot:scaffold390421_cov41-Prasinocladus_malaysianus.AAC.1
MLDDKSTSEMIRLLPMRMHRRTREALMCSAPDIQSNDNWQIFDSSTGIENVVERIWLPGISDLPLSSDELPESLPALSSAN